MKVKFIRVRSCLGCPYSQGYYSWKKLAMIRICELLGRIIKTPLESIPEDCPLEDL